MSVRENIFEASVSIVFSHSAEHDDTDDIVHDIDNDVIARLAITIPAAVEPSEILTDAFIILEN